MMQNEVSIKVYHLKLFLSVSSFVSYQDENLAMGKLIIGFAFTAVLSALLSFASAQIDP
jgi:hypothetical protein